MDPLSTAESRRGEGGRRCIELETEWLKWGGEAGTEIPVGRRVGGRRGDSRAGVVRGTSEGQPGPSGRTAAQS